MPRSKPDRAPTTNDRIREAGWFHGTETDWRDLSHEERQGIAFNALGCAEAYPTWTGPVNCVHVTCQIRRGELPAIAETNRTLRNERDYGYLRFLGDAPEDRKALARVYRAVRAIAMQTGVFDPWKTDAWKIIVGTSVGAIIRGR